MIPPYYPGEEITPQELIEALKLIMKYIIQKYKRYNPNDYVPRDKKSVPTAVLVVLIVKVLPRIIKFYYY